MYFLFLEECLEFLERQCLDIGLSVNIVRQSPMKPILIATWKGLDPSLPSLLLNSHMDVVAVDEVLNNNYNKILTIC